jgi:hypothetical protein
MKRMLKKICRTRLAFRIASPDWIAPRDALGLKKAEVPWAVRDIDTHMDILVIAQIMEGQGGARYGCVAERWKRRRNRTLLIIGLAETQVSKREGLRWRLAYTPLKRRPWLGVNVLSFWGWYALYSRQMKPAVKIRHAHGRSQRRRQDLCLLWIMLVKRDDID